MNRKYEQLRAKAFSAMQEMAAQDPDFEQARMLIGAADTEASLKKRTVRKSIDTEWIARVEEALPSLDQIIRNPKVFIEDEEEVVPVELTRRISEKSIKHLAQHTNLILKIEDDEITPSRILNVFHEESYLTYENKFTNTLLVRLAAFVDKRYQALVGGAGVEKDYEFEYGVDFEHYAENEKRSTAKVKLHIELNSPLEGAETTSDDDLNVQFASAIERIRKINQAITAYLSSPFVQKMGRNYIRPPVIRTNAILKNKHFKDCLTLWEFIEGYDKAGYSILGEEFAEMPSDEYVSDLYGLLALQYTQFYHGIVGDENKLLAERQMPEILPEFDRDMTEEELDDYLVYDSEYKKMVPVSRLMNNRKKLSEDEHRVREAIEVALRADEILNADLLAAEEEERRIERERLKAEEEARRRKAAMEEAAKRGPLEVRYKRSFLSRYIQSGEELQGYYTAIKNELLSYERVGARISWKCESFRRKKDTLARINVMGKSLYLYLALPFEDYAGKQGVSDASAKSADTPLLLKIKSERACKRAIALIAEMMQRLEVARIEREPEDYRMPYEDTEALIERGLVKRILPDGVVPNEFDELVTADVAARIGERKAAADEEEAPITAEEASAAEEPTAEEAVADEDAISEESAETVSENDENEGSLLGFQAKYRRSFLSRYIQSDEELQERYTAIKNELLSYDRVGARTSWKCETFRRKKETLARINVMGKSLYLYLALPLEGHEGLQGVSDAGEKSADTPLLVKVKSERSCKRALALIAEMMQGIGAVKTARDPEDYRMPYEDTETLVERGLVKRILTASAVIPKVEKPTDEVEEPILAVADEPSFDVDADDLVSEESAATVSENGEIDGGLLGFQAKYRRSFLSRYIQADEELQERYTAIKNELLSYDRVGARTSWKCETFRRKKETLARINVMGKSLYLYLALPLEGHEGLQGVSDAGERSADTPLLVKVKSERSCKRALALIAEMMQGLGAVKTARDPEDYRMPYEDTEALVERGLVKRIMTASAVIPKAETPTDEVEEPILAVADEPSFDVDADDLVSEESAATVSENGEIVEGSLPEFQAKYRRSFLARYIQASEELQERYTAIKNELLSYKRVSARTSWKCETYKLSKQVLARINVMGKSLYLYLALPLEGHEGLQGVSDAGERSADTPLLLKVKSERSCKRAVALIAEMMQGLGAVQTARDPEDYRMPFEDDETLFARGLLKQILRKNDFLAVTPEPVYEVAEETPALEETPVTVSENDAFAEEEAPAVSVEEVPEKVDEEPAILSEDPLAEEVVLSPIVEAPLATWERVEREVVDLAQVDFNDVEFIHDVTDAMLEKLGTTVYAVAVERKRLVERTCLRLEFTKIPKEQRKKLRVHPKNFIFRDENKPIDVSIPFTKGVVIPYTKKEYAALAASAKKQVQAYAERVREYDLTRAQLTVMRVLTITNISLVDKLQKLENRLALQRSMLPTASRWRALIKE